MIITESRGDSGIVSERLTEYQNEMFYKPKALILLTTAKCNSNCRHCCLGSYESEEEMDTYAFHDLIDQVCDIGIDSIGIAGREPFLRYKDTLSVLRYSSDKGIKSNIVTNGFWGSDKKAAKRKARELKEAGLDVIEFSIDPYHQEYVKLEYVTDAIRASLDADLNANIVGMYQRSNFDLLGEMAETVAKAINAEIIKKEEDDFYLGSDNKTLKFTRLPIFRVGNACKNINLEEFPAYELDRSFYKENGKHLYTKCPQIADYSRQVIVVYPSGETMICCGDFRAKKLRLGHFPDHSLKNMINKANKDILIKALAGMFDFDGIEKMCEITKRYKPEIISERYGYACELCNDILSDPENADIIENELQKLNQGSL